MFEAIKNLFSSREATEENKWDATTVQMQQPNSPTGMNETVTQQPTPETMDMHIRGGGDGDVCCGICAGLCCFECCECCC
ncbi:hypothetical protein N7520_006225 [Penicillium odoratum]|uniref:uncharacterized protein n=1 Tax=Penicillium odoratum TaxID=1167516 RepID=UPI00254959D3|nr:uncharacterized protein N7520_006225 [Penicillium odoratum]KAJ5759069.1 hypothetical protein N7520_006225 [Penicillium odoratum]